MGKGRDPEGQGCSRVLGTGSEETINNNTFWITTERLLEDAVLGIAVFRDQMQIIRE